MTQEQKELLIKDLCARLPYGVKIVYRCNHIHELRSTLKNSIVIIADIITNEHITTSIGSIKPYLFPLSSMTEEQLYNNPIGFSQMLTIKADRDWENITINRRAYYRLVDWFNKNHFDYRGLIEKGLAIDATNLNIY